MHLNDSNKCFAFAAQIHKKNHFTYQRNLFSGFERIRMLTQQKMMELQIWLRDIGDIETIAGYAHFSIGNATEGYALRVESYYVDAGIYTI